MTCDGWSRCEDKGRIVAGSKRVGSWVMVGGSYGTSGVGGVLVGGCGACVRVGACVWVSQGGHEGGSCFPEDKETARVIMCFHERREGGNEGGREGEEGGKG